MPVIHLQRFESLLQLPVTFEDFDLIKIVQGESLLEGQDVFIAPCARQGRAYLLRRCMTANVAHRCQGIWRPLARDDRPDDPHARDPRDIADHMMKLNVHLHQSLLHMLDIVNGKVNYTTGKTGTELWLPVARDLRRALSAMNSVGIISYLVTGTGKPFFKDGFGNKIREWCDEAGLP